MNPFVNETIAIALAALMGVAAGVWMRRGGGFRLSAGGDDSVEMGEELMHKADEFLARLQDLTTDVQSEVTGHDKTIQQINQELKESTSKAPAAMVAALSKLIAANEDMHQQLCSADLRLQHQARQIETHLADARTDALTGLCNRRVFDLDLQSCLLDFEQHGRPTSLMLLDIDSFKNVNDCYGHQAGDEVLCRVAQVLDGTLSEHETVYRYGGEEFAIVFSGSGMEAARHAAHRARDAVREAVVEFDGKELSVTASAGLSTIIDGDTARDLIHRADLALYASKDSGRDCGHWHDGARIARLLGVGQDAKPAGATDSGGNAHQHRATNHLTDTGRIPPPPSNSAIQLTELSNLGSWNDISDRTSFRGDVSRRLASWRRGGEAFALMLIRVDHYDAIAKTHGASAADTALLSIVQLLRSQVRQMDHTARFSDTALGVILPNIDQDSAILVGERIRLGVARRELALGDSLLELSVSIGLIESMKGHESAEKLIRQAESALEVAVMRGGNRTFVHSGKKVEQVFVLDSQVGALAAEPVANL